MTDALIKSGRPTRHDNVSAKSADSIPTISL